MKGKDQMTRTPEKCEIDTQFPAPTLAQRVAEKVSNLVGSWTFIIIQSVILMSWATWNVVGITQFRWDPYPFILMNLFLSLQAAYTAPLILIANSRQSEKDRRILYGDFRLDQQSHSLIKGLHRHLEMQDDKIDLILRESNIQITEEIRIKEENLKKEPA